ncbi:hypothetical protein [Salibacterium qingdaonense]|uniref:Uncharacterized protein n=1 Tax=Salibacterium qingdaonense TaxID=266892 RepID=A0A1I4N6H8_9BACI|nr:hypothetical protein [Salibacterium qingdaonense]SFM10843.1 hypothetical protein SAMN04488054_11549 [Salibacterium qingdaonense]
MNRHEWKPYEYPGTNVARIFCLTVIACGIQVILDHVMPFLHEYYTTMYHGAEFVPEGFPSGFDIYYTELPHVLLAYLFFIVPFSMYAFTIKKSKLFQSIFFTVTSLALLSVHDYNIVISYLGLSETIHLFRNAYISLPVMAVLHYFLPQPNPVSSPETKKNMHSTKNPQTE